MDVKNSQTRFKDNNKNENEINKMKEVEKWKANHNNKTNMH